MTTSETVTFQLAHSIRGLIKTTETKPQRRSQIVLLLLLNLVLVSISGCSTASKHGYASNTPDLSKIYVEPFSQPDSTALPTPNVATQLTRNITEQLAMENRLQIQTATDSLTLHGAILSYQDASLDVQAELYAGEEFLAYSRVRRQISHAEDLANAMSLITEQLLDELMSKMRDQPNHPFGEYYRSDPDAKQTGDPNNDSYYQHWGWWRHRPDSPGSLPERHWDADGKIEALPRSGRVIGDITAKRAEEAKRAETSDSSSTLLTVLGVIGVVLVFVLAAALADSDNAKNDCGPHRNGDYHHCSPSR